MPRRPYRRDTPLEEWTRAGAEPDFELPLPGPDGKPSETLKMRFRRVPAGSFLMGSREGAADEEPPHRVEVGEFWMGKFVVTQEEWAAVARCVKWPEEKGHDFVRPSHFAGERLPVEHVSWDDVQLWLGALQEWLEGVEPMVAGGISVRLLSEAEWEYGCRAGSRNVYWSGDGEAALADVGWYDSNSAWVTYPVDSCPRAGSATHLLGLVSMHGNVREWCSDAWVLHHVESGSVDEVQESRPDRAIRGGSWNYSAWMCRSAFRDKWKPDDRIWDRGFRVCLVPALADANADSKAERGPAAAGKPKTRDGSQAHGTGRPEETVVWKSSEALGFLDGAAVAGRNVTRLILGRSPTSRQDSQVQLSPEQIAMLQAWIQAQPGLRCLHLWNVAGIVELGHLPENPECLDLRHCPDLRALNCLPASLEFLWLDGCEQLARVPAFPVGATGLPLLEELSLRKCVQLSESAIHGLLRTSPELRWFDGSGCPLLTQIPRWPLWLERVELNDCSALHRLPGAWPASIRRVGLCNAAALESVPDFVADPSVPGDCAMDWLDLRGTTALRKLPAIPWSLRTLFLFGSGVPLAPELFGDDEQANAAPHVIPFLRQDWGQPRLPDNEVKVILLGNGRCGKTSLARRWIENRFDPQEPSTHGVHHWTHRLKFEPIDGGEPEEAPIHIWDFAGQDLYHNTHRLFLQSRAVFVICGTDQVAAADPDDPDGEWSEPHPLEYWLDQVRSLGIAPGMDEPPPIILVRTQAQKSPKEGYWRKIPVEAAHLPQVEFDASSEERGYLETLEAHLQQAVARVLGEHERRAYPASVLGLKREISGLLEKNDAEYRAAEAEERPAKAPHPTMTRSGFDAMATRLCPGYPTDRLIELLHRSGFLFCPGERLPEVVILDQRWATDALYILTERGSAMREHLLRHRGIAAAGDFGRLAWSIGPTTRQRRRVQYSVSEQALFLSFMQACGMCFELVPARLAQSDESFYAIPGFLPKADEARPDPAGDAAEWWKHPFEDVPESGAQAATVYLGRHWRRSALLWRWGGRVKAAESGSVLEVNWVRRSPDSYTGTLELRFLGTRDAGFAVEVVEELIGVIRCPVPKEFEALRIEASRREVRTDSPSETPTLAAAGIGPRTSAKPSVEKAVGVTVGFSYAGGGKARKFLGMIPRRAGELLDEWLGQGDRRGTVLYYDKNEGHPRLGLFLQQIAKGDLAVLFYSRPYWESHYCLTEALLIRNQRQPEGFAAPNVVVFVINGERISSGQTSPGNTGPWNHEDFEEHWRQKAEERLEAARVKKMGAMTAALAMLKREPFDDWYQAVQSDERPKLVTEFLHQRGAENLANPADAETAEKEARRVYGILAAKLGTQLGGG